MIKNIFIISICFVLFIGMQTVSAQEANSNTEPPLLKIFENPQIDFELREKISFARRMINAGQFDGAASYLEVLYEEKPSNPIVINLLKQCYQKLNQNFKLEMLLKKQIELDPKNMGYLLSLAELMVKDGRAEEALAEYKKSASLIKGVNRVRYQLIIQSMVTHNFSDNAVEFIQKWRNESGDNSLLGNQMGLIYEKKKEYTKALKEFYPLLKDTTQLGNSVERDIVELLLFENSRSIAEEYLLKKNEEELNVRAIKILSMHYIRTGELDKSFAFTKLRDSLYEKNGNSLISYMHTCKREKLFDEEIRMGEYLLSQYQSKSIVSRAKFLIADAYLQLENYEVALQKYNEIFQNTPSAREKSDALYYSAKIYQEYLHEIDTALQLYDSITVHYKNGMSYLNSLVELPHCYVQKGELEKAKSLYVALDAKRINVETKEKVYYQLAQTLFMQHNIDSSKTMLSKLLVNFPNGFYVNDALSLLKILQSGEDNLEVLYKYASTMLYEIQNKNDSAIYMYDMIANDPSQVLADFALYQIINKLFEQEKSDQAMTYVDRMEKDFSDSYFFPFALKQKADLYYLDSKKADEANRIYRQLLIDFPNYPFITEVRKLLRSTTEEISTENS